MDVIELAGVLGAASGADGATIALKCVGRMGEDIVIVLPAYCAGPLQIAVQDAAADAALYGEQPIAPVIAESIEIAKSRFPELDLLTVLLAGGLRLRFLVPRGSRPSGLARALPE